MTTCCLGSGCLSRPRSSQFPFGLSVTSMEWYVSKVSNESLHSAHQGQTVDAVRVLGGVCHLNPCYIPWNRGQSAPPFVPNGQSPACRTFILPDTSSSSFSTPITCIELRCTALILTQAVPTAWAVRQWSFYPPSDPAWAPLCRVPCYVVLLLNTLQYISLIEHFQWSSRY